MTEKFFRGYILARLSRIGTEWKVSNQVITYESADGNWEITYASPIYGAWDIIIEVSFKRLENLDEIVTAMREDEKIRNDIEDSTTLVSSKPNYPIK